MESVTPGMAFIEISNSDLINIIKSHWEKVFKLGKDIGIISYDDTHIKEVQEKGITLIHRF